VVLVFFTLRSLDSHHIGIINDGRKLKSGLASIKIMFIPGFMKSAIGSKVINRETHR
jgi:hypothetical protein